MIQVNLLAVVLLLNTVLVKVVLVLVMLKEQINKSGYSATFIGGSTMSGYPVPPHFQVRSLAQTEQK